MSEEFTEFPEKYTKEQLEAWYERCRREYPDHWDEENKTLHNPAYKPDGDKKE